MGRIEIKLDIMVREDSSIMTALAHPSLSPNPTISLATSPGHSLAALGEALNQLPNDPVSITVRVANKEVELWLVDRVTICLICNKERLPKPIQGWQTLRLRMPDECLGTNVPFGVQYPILSPTELRGKTIVYSGGPKNVPFPWFALEALTGWGVEVVYILRVITAAQLTHLIASAHYDVASLDFPLTLRVLGVERDIDETPPAKPVLYHSNYRLRTVDLGVVGPGIEHVDSLIGAPIAKITALELNLTEQKSDSVLKDFEECENLVDLRVECLAIQKQDTFNDLCVRIGLKYRAWERSEPGRVILTAKREEVYQNSPERSSVS